MQMMKRSPFGARTWQTWQQRRVRVIGPAT